MKTKEMLWVALSMTVALVMTACSNDDNNMTESPVAPSTSKTIPYTVTVNDGATTRATVGDDNRTLKFATGDKLYITGTNIHGLLELQDGDENKASGATFSGDLTYTGDAPADDLSLTATLVSAQQTVGTQVSVNAAGAVTVNYPSTAYCTSINDAVQKYSNLTGTSTYGAKSFTLTQQTAFLNFVITFEDGTATATALTAVINNNSADICTANVTTTTESEKVVAKFVLPVAKGTTLSSATVKIGDKTALAFTDKTLDGKVYNVKKTYYTLLSAATTSDYGKVVCADGHLHNAKTAVPAGCTAVGILGKVTETGHGLILALQDATSQTFDNIFSWAWPTYAGTKLRVLPDDAARGVKLTSYTALGATAVSNWAVAPKSDYEAIFTNLGSTAAYWDGQPYDANVNDYITGAGGTALYSQSRYWSATWKNDYRAWYFYKDYWGYDLNGVTYSVRPVLGF
jgi:hypothetical protein